MRAFFASLLLVLLLLTGVAWWLKPKASAAGKTVLIWVSDDNPARREQIALFNRLYPQYELRLDPSNAGMEKVIVQSLAGVGPDLFDCYNAFQLAAYVRSGIAWDITEKCRQAGIRVEDTWEVTHPIFVYEGRIYGHPTNAACDAIWFNKNLFDKYRIPYPKAPWTWEEFIALAKRLTLVGESGRREIFGFLGNWDWYLVIRQWGGRLYTPDGTRCIVDSPQATEAIEFLQGLIYQHHIMPSPVEEAAMATAGGWGTGVITFFGAEKGAMALGGRWWLCLLRHPDYKHLRLGAVEAPHGPQRIFRGYGRATLINALSPKREAAFAFIQYLHSKPYNDLINHQADALAPVKRYCYTPEYEYDPDFPHEAEFNPVWRDIMRYAVPQETSPFVNGQRAERILNRQMDLVKANQKSPAEALRDAARQINEEILRTLARDPVLRREYERRTGLKVFVEGRRVHLIGRPAQPMP